MKICVDKNHLVVIENEDIPRVKEYTYTVGGYMFSDFDKGILVLNKKVWKIINLKNLSDNMSVAYVKDDVIGNIEFSLSSFEDALKIFQGFDEESGKKYFFLPALWEKELSVKNIILWKLWSACILKKTDKGIVVESSQIATLESPLSFLLWLLVMYWKFDVKKSALVSMRIQLPLFWQYLKYADVLDGMMMQLQEQGIFMKSDKLQSSNWIIYQISCSDYEVLEVFAKWYEGVEKFEKITKGDFTAEMKKSLLEFIKTDTQIPIDGKDEVVDLIEKWGLKLLVR